jgi:hypothetical protein
MQGQYMSSRSALPILVREITMRVITSTINLGNGAFRRETHAFVVNPQLVIMVCTLAVVWALAFVVMAIMGGLTGPAMIAAAGAVIAIAKPQIPTWVRGSVVIEQTFVIPQLPIIKDSDNEELVGHH